MKTLYKSELATESFEEIFFLLPAKHTTRSWKVFLASIPPAPASICRAETAVTGLWTRLDKNARSYITRLRRYKKRGKRGVRAASKRILIYREPV